MSNKLAYTISLPKPCHESWETMTSNERGKFCDACQKNVIDFTRLSDNEIVKIIEQTDGNMCGRFSKLQLGREIYFEKQHVFFPLKARLIGGLLALATLQPIISYASKPNEIEVHYSFDNFPKKKTNRLDIPETPEHDTTKYAITGIAIDSLTKEPLPFVSVAIYNTTQGAVTDLEGKFKMTVNGKCTLKISYLGYKPMTIELTEEILQKNSVITIELIMLEDHDLYKVGGPMIERVPPEKQVINNPTDAQLNFILNNNR